MEILIAIIVLTVLILIHEAGHFFAARRVGMRVDEFGVGLPPRVWGKKRGETMYSINSLPLGGFVKIYGENGPQGGTQDSRDEARAFYAKSLSKRLFVLVAGVGMNFLLGVLIFTGLYMAGVPTEATGGNSTKLQNLHLEIIDVVKGSPAAGAGFLRGDTIVRMEYRGDVRMPKTVPDVQEFVKQYGGNEVRVEITRNGDALNLIVVPRAEPPEGEGPLGISLLETGILKFPWYRAPVEGVRTSFEIAGRVLSGLWRVLSELVGEGKVATGVAGPVGIVGVAGDAARLGFSRLMLFMALITINLAVLNLLPIPALDGGRALFLLIEKARGKPVSRKFESYTHAVGMAVLLTLIILVSINDVRRLF